jgi:hypothetical protein
VAGCLLGKRGRNAESLTLRNPFAWLAFSSAFLAANVFVAARKLLPLEPLSLHPVNTFGLVYHLSVLLLLITASSAALTYIRTWRLFGYVTLFGRHALLAFVIHVYGAKAIDLINYYFALWRWENVGLCVISVVAMTLLIRAYEIGRASERTPVWTRAVQGIFG